ncbi:GNAT family N-acetyltransferase [Tissierella sp. MSJ-40]|uniref:GNAT family N-acetyltransferase n=1 Tax=Tissierella simiarum TaxID=2841534 RepID=A0ABS6E8P9_9FIRM|nr:GNAT family N-acetyltransferase [Tissierella simiarum]MBU5439129.1 GNAT family N-acetyltransferase [Tissierella simiarum]
MELTLKTDRLLLHQITEEDFEFLIKLETRPENKKYEMEGIPQKDSIIKRCKGFIESTRGLPEEGAIRYIVYNEKNEMIGDVSLTCNWEKTKEWEIGYAFLSEYWGNGYATEAVRSVINFAFKELRIHKLMAFINSENTRSVALAKRIGMVQEGHMREARLIDGKWNDEFVFTLLETDLEPEA